MRGRNRADDSNEGKGKVGVGSEGKDKEIDGFRRGSEINREIKRDR